MISDKEKAIIEKLKTCLGYDAPDITQEKFDNIVEYIIQNETVNGNPKELIWRLCGCYEGLNFNKVIDIFTSSKDSYYTVELISLVGGNLDQKYLVTKMIETKDLEYIDTVMSYYNNAMLSFLTKENINLIRDYYNDANNTNS